MFISASLTSAGCFSVEAPYVARIAFPSIVYRVGSAIVCLVFVSWEQPASPVLLIISADIDSSIGMYVAPLSLITSSSEVHESVGASTFLAPIWGIMLPDVLIVLR